MRRSRSANAARASGRSSATRARRPGSRALSICTGWVARSKLAVNQKQLPWPCTVCTPTSPPISRARRRVMARPSPVPPKRRVVDVSACSKALNRSPILSAGTPTPVSRTEKRSRSASVSAPISSQRSTTEPRSVNFTALLIRLSSACDTRVGSPRSRLGTPSDLSTSSSPLARARSATRAQARDSTASIGKSVCSSRSLPDSILLRSSTSLITSSRWWAASLTLPSRSASRWLAVSRCIRWVRPMMAFIGVRISWLMLARNALLARLAASARSRAATSCSFRACRRSSACLTSEMSETSTNRPMTRSPCRSGM